MTATNIEQQIKEKALSLGFSVVGITTAELDKIYYERFCEALERGYFAEMGWLKREPEKRCLPKAFWTEAKSIIVLAFNIKPSGHSQSSDCAKIAIHACYDDYHNFIKDKLSKLADFIKENFGGETKCFVDSSAVLEKPIAEKAGIGWQGKHSLIVNKEFGSFILLGEIFYSIELESDSPHENYCGTCQKCIKACPTGAIGEDGRVDTRKCIAYHTIENKGDIPEVLLPFFKNYIYGCDECALACPFSGKPTTNSLYHSEFTNLKPEELVKLDEDGFNKLFAGTPIKRIGYKRFMRNILRILFK